MKLWAGLGLRFSIAIGLAAWAGCGGTEITPVVETLNGTCINCHTGLTNPHPLGAAISCVDCHGGDATARPFEVAGLEALLEDLDEDAVAALEAQGIDTQGTFIPVNPTKLADANDANFPQGRVDPAFQVILTAAHALPKGCAGPLELVDVDGDGITRVRAGDLNASQDPNNADCHAVFFWPNGMDDDGDGFVDELGEYSMFNPTDPIGLQYELSKIDLNNNGLIDNNESAVGLDLDQAKTFLVDIPGIGEVNVPVKLGQNLDSEFNMDLNYVRWMNPGDVRTAAASCGAVAPGASFSGKCHDQTVGVVRRSIMSYMSGVLAGAIYANGAIPNSRNLTDTDEFTDRDVQDLRDGRIAYLQNYDAIDNAFDREANKYLRNSVDGQNLQEVDVFDAGTITDLNDILQRSLQDQIDLNIVFGTQALFDEDVNGDDLLNNANGVSLNTNGLEQTDCFDLITLNGSNDFRGNLCLESYPEPLVRVDKAMQAIAIAAGVDPNDEQVLKSTTRDGEFTVDTSADNFTNRRPGERLIWNQVPLQDKSRSLFILAPIPRRTLTGANAAFLTAANFVAQSLNLEVGPNAPVGGNSAGAVLNIGLGVILGQGAAPSLAVVGNNILDDRQFSRGTGINPVDTALQTFRPFHSLSFPNITGDFFFFDEFQFLDNNANNDVFVLRNNPIGRGRGTGCTSCHVLYDADGVNREQGDPTVRLNGKQPGDVVLGRSPMVPDGVDGTRVGFRTGSLFNAAAQVGDFDENGTDQATANLEVAEVVKWEQIRTLVGGALGVSPDELPRLQFPTGMDDFGRERFYASQHKITTQIPSKQCEYCHAFVTRVGFAAFGRHENEGSFDFTNWYTWSPRDALNADGTAGADGLITHVVNDANNNGLNDGDAEADLGQFMNNRALAPGQDFLEFRNAVDPNQKVRIFNNLPAFVQVGVNGDLNGTLVNAGNRFPEDLNNNGILDPGENLSDLADGIALDQPDRPARDQIIDGRQQRAVYGGASGGVLLQDVHLQRGMHCIDCHFKQDNHGDGNLYARNWDAIEIECQDCHGGMEKSATLITSGPNGGHDLTLSLDQFGVKFFEVGNSGERIQRSRVVPGRQWRIPQVIDSITPGSTRFNPEAAEAMAVLNSAGENAHFAENVADANGVERSGAGKLECSSCHSSWTPNCMTCHMDFDHAQTVGEIWATQNRNPISFFQLFTIVRSPFVLAQAGSNERNKIMTHRSLMELHPNVTLSNGDALVENFTFSTPRGVSGVAMNQNMAHTVRTDETKDCDSCHTVSALDTDALADAAADGSIFDNTLNNNILSQTIGLGSGRLNEAGDFIFAASTTGLEGIDIKSESKRAIDDDGDGIFQFGQRSSHNTFQGFRGQGFGSGFLVSSSVDQAIINTGLDVERSFVGNTGAAADVLLLRNYIDPTEQDPNSQMFVGLVRATDLAVLAVGNNLDVRVVTDRTNQGPLLGNVANAINLDGAITAIDNVAPDMSDPYVYAVTANGQFAVVDMRIVLNGGIFASGLFGGVPRAGFNGQAVPASATVGTDLRDVEMLGNFAVVLDDQGADAQLKLIDARSVRFTDRETTPAGSQFKQVAVDFVVAEPGSLDEVGAVTLPGCANPRRVAARNLFAYVACGEAGVFVVNVENPLAPRVTAQLQDGADLNAANGQSVVATGALDDANGVFIADNRLFVANGNAVDAANAGVVVVDVTEPKNPRPVRTIRKPVGLAMVDPIDITSFVVPGQQWLMVSDSVGRAHAVNVSEAYNIRVRLGEHAAAARGLIDQDAEANGSVPGFRPQEQLTPFASQGIAAPRAFFEDTNVRFTLDLRDPTTPNDPAQIDEILQNAADPNFPLHIVSFNLNGTGEVRFAQTHDLDLLADWSGFPLRDAWASAVNINVNGCTTNEDGSINNQANCPSDAVNDLGERSASTLTGPRPIVENGQVVGILRGQMDILRGVFVREVNGVDLDGNGLGNLVCEGIVVRNAQGAAEDVAACAYPPGVLEAIDEEREKAKASASIRTPGQQRASR